MPHLDNLNHRLRTNQEQISKPNLMWVMGLALAISLLGVTEAWAQQSATVTTAVTDANGATITIQGPGQVLEFIYNAKSTYTGIPSFTAGTASFRHTFYWPQGTTFACYHTKGTDDLYTEQTCAPVTPGPPPTIGLSPTGLTFSGTQGGANPAAKTVSITNKGGGTLSWTVSDNAAWLSLSPVSGKTTTETDAVKANVNLTGLAAGTYNATITAKATAATNTPQTVPVTLTVTAAAPTPLTISLSPTSLTFSGTQGGMNPAAKTLSITNTGSGTLSWTVSNNAAWLSLSPASGTAPGGVTASANLAGLAAGTYSATITVTATGAANTPQTAPVTLTVTAVAPTSPTISLSPTSLTFSATQGGTNPAAKMLSITNTGSGTLSWTVSNNAAWLSLSPASGTAPGGVTASANLAGLTAGTYSATITVTANGATNTPQSVPITLTVTAALPTISLSPTSASFTGVQGGANPANQTLSLTNTGGGTMSWSVTDTATWLTLSPASGNAPGSAMMSVNLTGLTAGTYNATITVTATGASNSPSSVPVTLTVTAASPTIGLSPTSLIFSGTQGGTNPAAKTVSITNTGSGTLSWTVSDNAAWLSLSPASGPAPGSAIASVSLTGLAAGTYNATMTVTGTGATNTPQTVPVTLTVTTPVSQSAIVTSMIPDGSGATVTIQGLGQVLEFIYNAQSTYTGIPSFTAGTASFRHTFSWPQGTTFTCYRTRGTDNLYTEQACASVTPGPPPTSGTVTLTWNASTSSDVAGYKVYMGTASGIYGPATSVGKVITSQVPNLTTGQTYYFSVTALDASGNESSYSNEVSKSIY